MEWSIEAHLHFNKPNVFLVLLLRKTFPHPGPFVGALELSDSSIIL
jgi:hypothetical protein